MMKVRNNPGFDGLPDGPKGSLHIEVATPRTAAPCTTKRPSSILAATRHRGDGRWPVGNRRNRKLRAAIGTTQVNDDVHVAVRPTISDPCWAIRTWKPKAAPKPPTPR